MCATGPCLAEWGVTKHTYADERQTFGNVSYTYANATLAFTRAPSGYINTYFVLSTIMVCLCVIMAPP